MSRQLKTISTIATFVFAIPLLVSAQWTPAPASPPSNNTAAPVNVGGSTQTKTGSFGVDSNFAVGGNVGVGGSFSLLGIVGSTQCLRVNSAGLVSGTGADCGSGGTGITGVTISSGDSTITGGAANATTFDLRVNTTNIQRRVTGACSAANQSIKTINSDGTVTCETDDMGGGVTGSGTVNRVPKWSSATGLTNSNITDTGLTVTIATDVDAGTNNIWAGAFLYQSDERLKTNIESLKDAASNISKLNGVSFNWKSDGRADIGLIAQDVEKVYPEAVVTDTVTGIKSVDYVRLIAPLIEAVKSQQVEIDALKAEIELLKP